uniref:Aminotransferase-like plant mobile domain-containing protein n=1 Tax=Fagus sylvatica TaxID=28930 RepID=A0A2N9IL65_FAGSY
MATSSRKSTKGRGGTFSSKGGHSVTGKVAASRGSEDNGDSSSFGLGSSEPLGDILGRPTIDPWYRNGERFPSVPGDHHRRTGSDWIDSELVDREFCDRLEQVGVIRSILISRKPYKARNKFASMPEEVAAYVSDFQGDVPAVFRWVGSKFYDHSLIPSLDSESKVCWRPYEVTHRGFSYESVMSGFRNVEAQDYTLIAGDVRSLTYLSATNAGWLPVLSSGRLQFTAYSAHRVRRQFGFDQEIPAVMGIAGRNSGRGDISHLLESYTSLLPHPHLFVATNTMTTCANRQRLGYVVWYHEESQWIIYGNHHPPLWLRDHPHISAPGKVSSSRGRRTASAGTPIAKGKQSSKSKKRKAPSKDSLAQASKKKKTSATRGSKEVLILKTAVQNPSPAGESTAQGVSAPTSKKPVRKTRAGKRTFVPPAFPSAPSSIAARVDDLNSPSSSSSDKGDPSGAGLERTESEDAEITAAETVSGAKNVAAEVNSVDESTASSTSSGEEGVEAGTSTEEDEVSMDELEAAEATFDNASTASASKPESAKGTAEEHATVGVVTSAERVVETTPISIASSGETAQVMATVVPTAVTVQDSEAVPVVAEEVLGDEEVPAHIPDALEGNNFVESIPIYENLVIDTDFGTDVTHVEHEEVAASEDPVQIDVVPGSGIPTIEETLAQDPVDDISLEDMADTCDSYDEVLAETEDHVAGAQAADMEVTAPVTAHTSPTETVGSGNEAVAEEERRHQTAAVESTIRGQPGSLFATRSATLWSSVLADMDAFFREFDRMSISSYHVEHFWIFDDVKADFEVFRVPQGRIRFLKALWEKYGSCSSYFRLGVHVGSSMLTLLCCVLAHMEHTRLEDVIEVHILEWKAVVQKMIKGGFKFNFILDYLRRLAHDIFSRRILAELREVEAHVTALRDALNIVVPNSWDLASTRRVSAESHAESVFHGLLA